MTIRTLVIKGLSVRLPGRMILRTIALPPVRAGELVVLAGPNAAGKSTLLRAVAGLVAYSGEVYFEQENLGRLSLAERARRIGYLPQSVAATTELTVIEAVLTALRAGETSPPASKSVDYAFAVLDRLRIRPLALESLDRLSGGQRQVVGLAQAIARDPPLILLDEPTSALDLARQHQVMSEARGLAREGRIVVAVLHDLALASRWADRIAVLKAGEVHSFGRPEDVVTPAMLRDVYGVEARVEPCSRGFIQIGVDGLAQPDNMTLPQNEYDT